MLIDFQWALATHVKNILTVSQPLVNRQLIVSIFLTAPDGELTVSKRLAHSSLTAFCGSYPPSQLTAYANEALS